MRDLSNLFTAREVYVTENGHMHSVSDNIECTHWMQLADGLEDTYPDWERIEISTFDVLENGVPDFASIEDWEIVRRHGTRILLKVVDCD